MVRKRIRHFCGAALAIVAVSLIVQGLYLVEAAGGPTFHHPIIDAGVYHEAAVRFANGRPLDYGAFWQPPLFPLLLGCLYRVVGVKIMAAKICLAFLATGSCLLVWRLGASVFSRRVGLIAAIGLTLYGPFIFFSLELLPTGLGVFLNLLALSVWLGCLRRPRWDRWLLLGLLIGVAILAVPNAAVLLVLAGGGLIFSAIHRARLRPVLHAGFVLLGCCAAVAPVTIRNYRVSGEWVLVSTNGGINFFIGNNPDREHTVAIRPGEYWKRLGRLSYGEGETVPSSNAQDAYFWKHGLAYAYSDPVGFLTGLGRKAIRLINAREIPRNVDIYVARDDARVLRALVWRFRWFAFPAGLILPLGMAGMALRKRLSAASLVQQTGEAEVPEQSSLLRSEPRALARADVGLEMQPQRLDDRSLKKKIALATYVLAYTLSIMLFFVAARYRMPIVPVVMLFAAALVVHVWDSWKQACKSATPVRNSVIVLALLAAFLVVNAPVSAPTDGVNFSAERAMCVAQVYARHGSLEEAEQSLRSALAMEPDYADATGKLANVLARQGRLDEAETLARRALMLDDDSLDARWILGDILHRRRRLAEAAQVFRGALSIDGCCGEAHNGLAEVLLEEGKIDQAVDHFRSALRCGYRTRAVVLRLARLLTDRGDFEEGIALYREAVNRFEVSVETLNALAWLLATCPQVELRDCGEAIRLAERLCRETDYHHAVALDTLAAAYAECGRIEQAIFFIGRAIELARSNQDAEALQTFTNRLHLYESRQ